MRRESLKLVEEETTWIIKLVVGCLWLGTIGIGLYEIVILRGMVLRIYAVFWSNRYLAVTLGNWAIVAFAMVWIAFAFGTGEYHFRHVGERGSWRLLVISIAVEVAILLLTLFV
jgi:hypothetical protein